MTDRFKLCLAETLRHEGGYSNQKHDPGGKTQRGITEAVYHDWLRRHGRPIKPVINITNDEVETIYHTQYWVPCGGPNLHPGVDLATFDASVNSGVSRGRKWLLASVGGPDDQTVQRMCRARLSFVQGLKTWSVFGRGWGRRIADVEAKGVAWALAAGGAGNVPERLASEAKAAQNKAERQSAGGAGAAGGGAVSTVVEQGSQLPDWIFAAVAVVCIGAAVVLIMRSRVNRARAEAYAKEAEQKS